MTWSSRTREAHAGGVERTDMPWSASLRFNPAVTDARHPNGYTISTDPAKIDRKAVWAFLRASYWSPGIEFELVSRAIDNSLPFVLLAHPDLRNLRIILATHDAHGLYERFGFHPVDSARMMERPRSTSPR